MSRLYNFIGKQPDWKTSADENVNGIVEYQEVQKFLNENFEWDGETTEAGKNDIINRFWLSMGGETDAILEAMYAKKEEEQKPAATNDESLFRGVWNDVKSVGKGIGIGAAWLGKNVVKGAGAAFKGVGKAVGWVAKGVGSAVSGVVKGVGSVVSSVASGVASGVGSVVSGVAKGVASAVSGVAKGIGKIFKGW